MSKYVAIILVVACSCSSSGNKTLGPVDSGHHDSPSADIPIAVTDAYGVDSRFVALDAATVEPAAADAAGDAAVVDAVAGEAGTAGLCKSNTDCTTGCCFDEAETGQPICSPASVCSNSCGKQGTACTSGNECCTGMCVTSTVADWAGCRKPCTKSTDCSTNCCQVFSSGTDGFCADARWCSCGAVGATCGANVTDCCDGTVCSSLNNDPKTICRRRCRTAADCPNGTCSRYFTGQNYGACY